MNDDRGGTKPLYSKMGRPPLGDKASMACSTCVSIGTSWRFGVSWWLAAEGNVLVRGCSEGGMKITQSKEI